MSVDLSVVEAFEAEIDKKLDNANKLRRLDTSHMAEVKRVDKDGTVWVHIFGGALETPIRNSFVTTNEGDLVNVSISNGSATITGSSSAPAASTYYVEKSNQIVGNALRSQMAAILGDIVQIKHAIISQATIDDLLAHYATIQQLAAVQANINDLTAGVARIDTAMVNKLDVNFMNAREATIDQLGVIQVLAQSGVFDQLSMRDGAVTGRLAAVTVHGDLIQADTIAANRIIFQGTDEHGNQNGLWYQLNATGWDGEAHVETYSQIENPDPTASPHALNWYEFVDNEYVLSDDVAVDSEKTYYQKDDPSAKPNLTPEQLEDDRYKHALDGSHIVAESITANKIDVDSITAVTALVQKLRAVMLLAEQVQVGGGGSTHIELIGNRFSFFAPNYGQSTIPKYELTFDTYPVQDKMYYSLVNGEYIERPASEMSYDYNPFEHGLYEDYQIRADRAMPGEVAYIAVDPTTNESMFYITRAVVVKDLRFGNWKWYDRFNGNLSLKWMGGAV